MKIYIVQGSTGEYSDHIEWIVCAYKDEKKAQEHVVKASEAARQYKIEYHKSRITPETNPYDPQFQMDYTGTNYTVIETELKDPK
jgi:hypothetical protein